MFVVGLTGGIGSGKSTVASLFGDLGIEVVDADLLAREVVAPGTEGLAKIVEHFGDELIDYNGTLKRSELRQIVFAEPQQKAWLENLLHPLIAQLIQSRIAACSSGYCLLVSPLLLETSQHEMVDKVLVVDVSVQSQLNRTLERDGGDVATIKSIIASQMSRDERLVEADDVIDNEQDIAHLKNRIEQLHQHYIELASAA